jgi:hypothetical protein
LENNLPLDRFGQNLQKMANKDIKKNIKKEKIEPSKEVKSTSVVVTKESISKQPGTKILRCTCSHEFQDKTYGRNMRVHNRLDGKGSKVNGYACTVCLDKKT